MSVTHCWNEFTMSGIEFLARQIWTRDPILLVYQFSYIYEDLFNNRQF